ncbi:hypothetical protein DM02DRAFT_676198 [Periconia macrospinosa]|uniref:Tetraspanin Tsp3 n=1 Tax=Periconia macrospinosa TaxID=97972 RepID=A0A2V1D8H6_9PLEO|nr:hypothetical protein DM02DRAFT_676198 [Periconia macrospinosa]
MPYSREQIVTCISIIYLIIATALSGYGSSRVNRFSIPLPNGLAYAATFLPIIAGLLLKIGYVFTRYQEHRSRLPRGDVARLPLVIVMNTLIFIYSTVVVTLLGTHAAPPPGLDCGLQERWIIMFRNKDARAIKAIQDAFNCCGLKSSHDMAWPFPDKTHKADACELAFGRKNGCFKPWKIEEQRVAGILMGAVGLVFIWQFAIIATPTERGSWFDQAVPERTSRTIGDEGHGGSSQRREIDFLPNFSRYSDRAQEASDGEAENGPQRGIDGTAQQANNTLTSGVNQVDHRPLEDEWGRP